MLGCSVIHKKNTRYIYQIVYEEVHTMLIGQNIQISTMKSQLMH